VGLRQDGGYVYLDVVNDSGTAPAAFSDGTGAGLAGMPERAAALAGTLDAGPRPGGGFAVHARLPVADIRMPGTDGLEATRRIVADPELSGVRVIILTTYDADEHVFEAIRAGASGFLVKDTEPEDLISAIRVVARGDALLSPSVTRRLISSIAGRGPAQPVDASALSVLTDREREVLARVAAGMSNDEIAAVLFMSPLTAKTHVNRMMAKLGARDQAQLVVIAYETGLVRAGLS
jgi:DNA-binding NarL/FixJ family response regulator